MQTFSRLIVAIFSALILTLGGTRLDAAQFSGQVRAADQLVPGAMVTAKKGDAKVIAYTDENGTLHDGPAGWRLGYPAWKCSNSRPPMAKSPSAITPRIRIGRSKCPSSANGWVRPVVRKPAIRRQRAQWRRQRRLRLPERRRVVDAAAEAVAVSRGGLGGFAGGGGRGFGGRGAAGASGARGATGATGAQGGIGGSGAGTRIPGRTDSRHSSNPAASGGCTAACRQCQRSTCASDQSSSGI